MRFKRILHKVQRPGLIIAVTAAALYAFSGAGPAVAGQLIYTPVNPSFGGNPLNGTYLLQKAQNGKKYPMPMDDLNLPNMDGIVAQTDSTIVFKQGDSYYAYDMNTHSTTKINFADARPSDGPGSGSSDLTFVTSSDEGLVFKQGNDYYLYSGGAYTKIDPPPSGETIMGSSSMMAGPLLRSSMPLDAGTLQ